MAVIWKFFRKELLKKINLLDLFSEGSYGIQIVKGLDPLDEPVLYKTRYSAFFGTDLDGMLRDKGITTVLVSGTQTPNCVRSTAVDALSHDFRSIVLADCTSSRTEQIQQSNLADMEAAGIEIASSLDQILPIH